MIEIYFILTVVLSLTAILLKGSRFSYVPLVIFLALQLTLLVHEAGHLDEIEDRFFKADAIGLIFLGVLTAISVPAVLHSYVHALSKNAENKAIAYFNGGLIVFIATMSGALLSTHVGAMWGFLEATSLSGGLLIYHNRTPISLEGAWKYVFISSVGIALAFAGILFLSIASADIGHVEFGLDDLRTAVTRMNPMWLKASFLFVITGFSVKMGIVPLYPVDIDAKDSAPSPVGAMFSGGLMNVGFVAIYRFYELFSGTSILGWMNGVLLICGVASIALAAAYLMKVHNLKRVLAYSSLEHGGIALLGLAAGGVGYAAAILHLVFHGLVKAGLFFQFGQIFRVYHTKNSRHMGGYLQIYPMGGVLVLLCFLVLIGLPPGGLFFTELMIFQSLFASGKWWIGLIALALLSLAVFGFARTIFHVLFFPVPAQAIHNQVKPFEAISQYLLVIAVLALGVMLPPTLSELLNLATQNLPK
jgi:hydrogenase-4 component F